MTDNPYEDYLLNLQVDKEQVEKDFQTAFSNMNISAMWWNVYITCLNIAKSIYKTRGVTVPNEVLLEKALDAAAYCMSFILGKNKKYPEGVHPEKLSSYCYLRVLKFIQDPKEVWYESNVMEWKKDEKGNYLDLVEVEYDA